MDNATTFASAFVEAALWADTPDDYTGNGLAIGLASSEAERMRNFAYAFYSDNRGDCDSYPEGITQCGHDLWFTINGHGVGFWENKDDVSARLDSACQKACPYSEGLMEGDDGLLYWIGGAQ